MPADHQLAILVIDDDPMILTGLSLMLADHRVVLARNLGEARALATRTVFDVILSDFQLGLERGTSLLQWLREKSIRYGMFVFMTGDPVCLRQQQRPPAVEVLEKPFDFASLQAVLARACPS